MASEVLPGTLRKKQLASESLPVFLDRMVLVWVGRQRRLAEVPVKALAAQRRHTDKLFAADPEAFLQARRDAVARYAKRHPDRVKETKRRGAERKKVSAVPVASARDAKRVDQPEGYPKAPQKPAKRKPVAQPMAVVPQDSLSRAWFGGAGAVAARHEDKGSPALSVISD